MESTTIEKKTEIDNQESFFAVLSFYSQQSLLQELEINQQLLRSHFLKKDDLSS